jgi:hypothetical protein
MVSVRVIKVGDSEYIQVVEYERSGSQTKTKVVGSFGKNSLEARMRAEQFASEYDRLKEIATSEAAESKTSEPPQNFVIIAMAVFGVILGAAVIAALLAEIFKQSKR